MTQVEKIHIVLNLDLVTAYIKVNLTSHAWQKHSSQKLSYACYDLLPAHMLLFMVQDSIGEKGDLM